MCVRENCAWKRGLGLITSGATEPYLTRHGTWGVWLPTLAAAAAGHHTSGPMPQRLSQSAALRARVVIAYT